MTYQFVPLSFHHLPQIQQIENQAHRNPWSEKSLTPSSSKGALNYVLLQGDLVVGYFYARDVVREISLLNIAVEPAQQGKGLGKLLLDKLVELAESNNVESIWLEVRQSNQAAISLYQKVGFQEVCVRKDYYPNGDQREDAIVMSLPLRF